MSNPEAQCTAFYLDFFKCADACVRPSHVPPALLCVCVFACVCVRVCCLSVCMSVCLYVCMYVCCLSLSLSVCCPCGCVPACACVCLPSPAGSSLWRPRAHAMAGYPTDLRCADTGRQQAVLDAQVEEGGFLPWLRMGLWMRASPLAGPGHRRRGGGGSLPAPQCERCGCTGAAMSVK